MPWTITTEDCELLEEVMNSECTPMSPVGLAKVSQWAKKRGEAIRVFQELPISVRVSVIPGEKE
jgi:hypothetical protein